MTARAALKAARAAGVEVRVDGDDLLLEASTPPPDAVLELLSIHKPEVIALLRPDRNWTAEDWRALFDERAGIADYDGGLSRLDAEMYAFEDCVDHWLALHPPPADKHDCCLRCGRSVSDHEKASVVVTCVGGTTGRLHASCASDWKNLRRWHARSALMWLLNPTQKASPANHSIRPAQQSEAHTEGRY